MNVFLLKVRIYCETLIANEDGQDMVEYALVVALVAFGAVLGMKGLASGINSEFNVISSTLTTDL